MEKATIKSLVTEAKPWEVKDQPELREQGKHMKRVEPKNKNISSESADVKANSDFET